MEENLFRIHPAAEVRVRPKTWTAGTEILFYGEQVRLEMGVEGAAAQVRFGDQVVRVAAPTEDWRPAVERHLWRLGARDHSLGSVLAGGGTGLSCLGRGGTLAETIFQPAVVDLPKGD